MHKRVFLWTAATFVSRQRQLQQIMVRQSSSSSRLSAKRRSNKKATPVVKSLVYPPELLKDEHPPVKIDCLHPGTIWVGRNFLSPDECQNFVRYSEQSGAYERKFHKATRFMAHRDCYEHLHYDTAMAERLFQRMQTTGLMDVVTKASDSWSPFNYRPVGCNPNTKVYKYEPGMWFGRHVDVSDPMGGKNAAAQTEITVLVYLSECKGGATKFYPPGADCIAFRPEMGSILLHVHGDRCLDHEGDRVVKGMKYVLRTDVVYDYV